MDRSVVASNITATSKLKELNENVCRYSGADRLKVDIFVISRCCSLNFCAKAIAVRDMIFSDPHTMVLLMCWVITCLSSTMTCLFFCGAEAQYWGGGA